AIRRLGRQPGEQRLLREEDRRVDLPFEHFLLVALEVVGEPDAGAGQRLHLAQPGQVLWRGEIADGDERRPDVWRPADAVEAGGDVVVVGGQARGAGVAVAEPPV